MTASSSSAAHPTLKSYLTGFVLCVVLTVIPFALVMTHALEGDTLIGVVFAFAAVQMVAQFYYFLHIDRSPAQHWNLLALIFTVVVVGLLVGGSIWIMINVAHQMMPGMMPMSPGL
jgi:cytochrome o ubiquinol oxidase operon protein cyoD